MPVSTLLTRRPTLCPPADPYPLRLPIHFKPRPPPQWALCILTLTPVRLPLAPISIPILNLARTTKIGGPHGGDIPLVGKASVRETKGELMETRGFPGSGFNDAVELGVDGGAGGPEEKGWGMATEGHREDVYTHSVYERCFSGRFWRLRASQLHYIRSKGVGDLPGAQHPY